MVLCMAVPHSLVAPNVETAGGNARGRGSDGVLWMKWLRGKGSWSLSGVSTDDVWTR